MDSFQQLINSSIQEEMSLLCERSPSFFHFGNVEKCVVEGITSGRISVQKYDPRCFSKKCTPLR